MIEKPQRLSRRDLFQKVAPHDDPKVISAFAKGVEQSSPHSVEGAVALIGVLAIYGIVKKRLEYMRQLRNAQKTMHTPNPEQREQVDREEFKIERDHIVKKDSISSN